jgi:hypothetical protein
MPIIFGSAGDIISVIQLVQAFVQALDGSRGSGAEYREVKRELLALEKVLLEIHNLADLRAASPEIDAILQAAKYAAEQCHSTIEPYFGRVKKYNKYLQEGGSGSLLIDAFFKARWRLSHHEELTKFRAIINAHVGSLTLLLVTANLWVTCLLGESKILTVHSRRISGISASLTSHGAATSPPVGRAEPSANKEMAQSMEHQMKSTKDITSLIQSFSTVLQLQWFRKFTEDVKQTLQNILHLNILMYMAISPQQDLRADQPLFTPPWVLDDPFGKIDPVHSEFLGSWEVRDR